MAFSNPVFLDADGGGYDKPPLAAARAAALSTGRRASREAAFNAERASRVVIPRGTRPTPADLGRLVEAMSCRHDAGATPHHHAWSPGPVAPRAVGPAVAPAPHRHDRHHDHSHGHGHSH
jgi:hypothetical protein